VVKHIANQTRRTPGAQFFGTHYGMFILTHSMLPNLAW